MISHVSHIPLLVHNQEEAKQWFTEKLGFEVRSDSPMPGHETARWITLGPKEQPNLEIVLQPTEWGLDDCAPDNGVAERNAMIGKQPGWILLTENCAETYSTLKERGVTVVSDPMEMPWGITATFKDLYGNLHTLVGPLSTNAQNN